MRRQLGQGADFLRLFAPYARVDPSRTGTVGNKRPDTGAIKKFPPVTRSSPEFGKRFVHPKQFLPAVLDQEPDFTIGWHRHTMFGGNKRLSRNVVPFPFINFRTFLRE